jgi:hypothetical protein
MAKYTTTKAKVKSSDSDTSQRSHKEQLDGALLKAMDILGKECTKELDYKSCAIEEYTDVF